jgi:hypothetical protein
LAKAFVDGYLNDRLHSDPIFSVVDLRQALDRFRAPTPTIISMPIH